MPAQQNPDTARLIEDLKATRSHAAVIKGFLAENEERLRRRHLEGKEGIAVCRDYTLLIDEVLKALFAVKASEIGCSDPTALVAIGGYGRRELNIRSDIDILLLHKKKVTRSVEDLTQQVLYILWDTGLDLGFSIRSVEETISLAKDDLKTMTALLDSRHLLGDERLYGSLVADVRKRLFTRVRAESFINDKIEETRQRQAKYGGSVYILEPNVKEGEGGLRDMHTAVWILKAKSEADVEPFSMGLISHEDRAALEASVDFILWVRNEMHFHSNRKTDQLTFDQQERIAAILGFVNTDKELAVESFMQHYYRHATNVNHYSNLMLSRCLNREVKPFLWPRKSLRVDKSFTVTNGALTARDGGVFAHEPSAAIKAFEYSQSLGAELTQSLKDMILSFTEGADASLTSLPEFAESFIRILKGKNVYKTLFEMQRLKFLEWYIPEFRDISCKVQHDLYHVYTVDAHTLFAVKELEDLKGPRKADFPLLATIFEEIPNPEILYLSVLFHDIGKAHGKGHAEKGAQMAPHICKRLHLPEDGANIVKFLVRHHLLLADTAQYRDLHDERLVIEFAKTVGDIERLNLLYLLTFADVRAVGPDVWSQWKGALFQELYFKALTVLERGTFEAEDAGEKLMRIRHHVMDILKHDGVDRTAVDDFFQLLPHRYFLSTSPDFIAEHIKALREFAGKPCYFTVRQDAVREYTEFVVCTHDVHGLFSMITGVMAANAVNILGAQINTLKNGIALDVLQVTSAVGGLIDDDYRLKKIEGDLHDVITGRVKVSSLVARRKPSILDKKAKPKVRSTVQIDNDVSESYTVIDIHTQNRIGLLYDITSTLSVLGLYIYVAKIATKGDEAADIFYVKDIFGQKIYYKERLNAIADTIYGVLTGEDAAKHGP